VSRVVGFYRATLCQLARILPMSVPLSVTSRSSIEMAERIVMVLGMGAFSTSVDSRRPTLCSSAQSAHSSTLKRCITKIRVSTKIRVFSFGTLPHTLDFKKFHHYRSIVEMCYQLSLTQVNDQSVIDWTVVDQQSWQLYLRVPTVDRQVTSSSVYSTIPSRGFIKAN